LVKNKEFFQIKGFFIFQIILLKIMPKIKFFQFITIKFHVPALAKELKASK
tara:strand:- start:5721 stop:5873 length:153 start_codon:yes stop_codon:yes gene_type:complete